MHLFHFLFVGRRPWDPSKRTKRSRSDPRKLLAASGSPHSSRKSGEVDRWKYVAILTCRQCWLFLTDFLAICGYNCCKVWAIWSNFRQFHAISCNPISCNLGQFKAISTNFSIFWGLRHAIFKFFSNFHDAIRSNLRQFFAISGNLGQFRPISRNLGQFWGFAISIISCNFGQFRAISGNFGQF